MEFIDTDIEETGLEIYQILLINLPFSTLNNNNVGLHVLS